MKSQYSTALAVSVSAILAACSGGGDEPSLTSSASDYTLTGSVPGTLIEVFCDDGSYHATHSDNNGTNRHPFELSLPTDQSCRLVMTTNEDDSGNQVVTPIRLKAVSGQGGIAFTAVSDLVDLGYIDLPLNRDDMLADDNNDGVEDFPREVSLSSEQSASLQIASFARDPLDADNDGIVNHYEDDDDDGISNRDDPDDDNDGLPDELDNDRDNDGVSDNDLDGDGITNDRDVDDDNDGKNDDVDEDDDNDGTLDEDDSDDDNDGIEDSEDRDNDEDEDRDEDDDSGDDSDSNDGTVGGVVPPSSPSAGRLLASQCAQCHGTNGYSLSGIDSLAGESAAEIIEEMNEMKQENDNEIMHKQAKGYSDEQIRLMAEYFAQSTGGGNGDD